MQTNNKINRQVVRIYDVFDNDTGIRVARNVLVANGRILEFLDDIGINNCYAMESGTTQKKQYKHNSKYQCKLGTCVYTMKGQHYS